VLTLAATVLRDPLAVVDEADRPDALSALTPRLLALATAGFALFGAVVGSYRGGIQVGYAALKMPFLLAIPLVVCLPAVRALYEARGVRASWPRLALAGLVGAARTGILAAASLPLVWLVYSVGPDYHDAILFMTGVLGVVGLPGLLVVARALPDGGELRWIATAGSLALLVGVTAQTGWLLRPFVVRPAGEVAFLRPVESDVVSALSATGSASTGDYQDWEPEKSGLLGRGLRR
jgi:hypothetical protein